MTGSRLTRLERAFARALAKNGIVEFHNINLPYGICSVCGKGPPDFEKDGIPYHIECYVLATEESAAT